MSKHERFTGQLKTDYDLVRVLRDHGVDYPREDSIWHLAANRLQAVLNQRDALLALVYMHKADNDPKVAFDQFFALVRGFGHDPEQESAAEFMIRLGNEAIAMCPEPKPKTTEKSL
jgi:hypothetical protein